MLRLAEESTLIKPRLEDQVRAEDDEQERAAKIKLEDHLGEAANQGEDAEEGGEAAHAQAVEVARRVQAEEDQADANVPDSFGEVDILQQELTAEHDQEETPEGGFETLVERSLFGVNDRGGFGCLFSHFSFSFFGCCDQDDADDGKDNWRRPGHVSAAKIEHDTLWRQGQVCHGQRGGDNETEDTQVEV